MGWRILSVFIGAVLASGILALSPPVGIMAALIMLGVVLAGATQGSRWYISPAFTTFIVFFVMLYVNHAPRRYPVPLQRASSGNSRRRNDCGGLRARAVPHRSLLNPKVNMPPVCLGGLGGAFFLGKV